MFKRCRPVAEGRRPAGPPGLAYWTTGPGCG